ncbi:MAG: PKD domain-containing protein [Candidatus Thiodiazotropha sp.]
MNTNQVPIADAGVDQTAQLDSTVQLDGSASYDPDGAIVKYLWRQTGGAAVELNNSRIASPSFIATTQGEIILNLTIEDENGARSSDVVYINVGEATVVAVAGDDGEGVEESVIILDGGQSSASGGSIASYYWEQISGPSASIYWGNVNSARLSLWLPQVEVDTPISYRLTVVDDQGVSATDEITILVLANLPPQAIPIPVQTVVEGDYYVMDATTIFGVQPGDTIELESYRWEQIGGPPVTLQYRRYRAQARILAPEVVTTTQLVFEITARDRSGALGRNTVTLNIIPIENLPENNLPQAVAGEDRVSISNHYIVVDGSASSDSDGEIVSYEWEIIDAPSNPNIVYSTFRGDSSYPVSYTTPVNYVDNNVAGDYTIRLTVTDDRGGVSTDDVIVTLNPDVNIGESPTANAGSDRRTRPYYHNHDERLSLSSAGSADSDGSIEGIYWQQISGPKIELNGNGFSPVLIQDYVRYLFLLTVVDDQGNQDDDQMFWSVGYSNTLPVAHFTQPQLVAISGGTIRLDGSSSYDHDDYIDSFNWTQTSGPAVSFLDYSVEPIVQLPYVNAVSRVDIDLSVTDLSGATSNTIDSETFLIVNPDYENTIISAGDDIAVFSGAQVELTGQVLIPQECDPFGGCTNYGRGLTWYQLDGPPILDSVDNDGTFTFTAPLVDERATITLALVDVFEFPGFGMVAQAVDPVRIEVLPVTQGVNAVAGPDQQAIENTQIVLDGSASDVQTGSIVSYKWEQVQGPDALIVSPDQVATQVYLPAVAVDTELAFVLTVVRDDGLEAYDVVGVSMTPDLTDGDYDADGIADDVDLFPGNPTEAYDLDGDGEGDNSDFDRDGDGVANNRDYYPNDADRHAIPEFEIAEPLDGAVINRDYVIVKGTVTTDQNLGFTVNEIVAERVGGPNGNQFVARIPLAEGANRIVVTATSQSGKRFSQDISVTREGQDPVDFYITEKRTVAPFTSTFSFASSLGVTVNEIEVDFEGDGVYDETITAGVNENLYFYYDVPGVYYPQARFTLASGEQYVVTQVVSAISQVQLEQHLRELWTNMNLALTQQNHGRAVGYVAEENRDKYSEVFYLLLPYFSEIVSSYSALATVEIYSSYASYLINRDIEGVDHAFFVSFVRGEDGLWRVSSM